MSTMPKSRDAFRTISEVADWLETPAHVLRFWESKFSQVKPVKRAGGRRYYRPADMELLGGIKKLLHEDGMTIKGVQKLLREQGVRYVASLSPQTVDGSAIGTLVEDAPYAEVEAVETVVPFARSATQPAPQPAATPAPAAAQPEEEDQTQMARKSTAGGAQPPADDAQLSFAGWDDPAAQSQAAADDALVEDDSPEWDAPAAETGAAMPDEAALAAEAGIDLADLPDAETPVAAEDAMDAGAQGFDGADMVLAEDDGVPTAHDVSEAVDVTDEALDALDMAAVDGAEADDAPFALDADEDEALGDDAATLDADFDATDSEAALPEGDADAAMNDLDGAPAEMALSNIEGEIAEVALADEGDDMTDALADTDLADGLDGTAEFAEGRDDDGADDGDPAAAIAPETGGKDASFAADMPDLDEDNSDLAAADDDEPGADAAIGAEWDEPEIAAAAEPEPAPAAMTPRFDETDPQVPLRARLDPGTLRVRPGPLGHISRIERLSPEQARLLADHLTALRRQADRLSQARGQAPER